MSTANQAIGLNSPVLDKAIRAVNFFNGRLLTSNDLGREQDARRQADARLGPAIGAGIAWGLEVRRQDGATRTVQVRAGLAISRAGQALQLGADQLVSLVALPDAVQATAAAFGPCGVLSGSTAYVAGDGLYLLTLAPTAVAEGKAPVLALDPGNVRCNTDATVEAVQLRLLHIGMEMLSRFGLDTNAIGAAAVSRLRNAVAYACFGFPAIADAHLHAGIEPAASLLDEMRLRGLSDCDVPLALIYLTSSGIGFVDRWAARRRIAADCAAPAWSALVGEEMDALGEAQLAQFQEQLADVSDSAIGALRAAESFAWLPPAGFLPAAGARQLDWRAFLGPHQPAREVPLAAGDLRGVLADALRRDPVPVSAATRYRVYRISGSEQWLFVREAPNSPHAEEVWFDGARAGLEGVTNVQAAIDMLRARSCRQLVVWPGADAHALVDALSKKADLSLCFEAGDHKLKGPLVLEGLGHVTIHGAGPGSRLLTTSGDCALMVTDCMSVTVTGLSFSAERMQTGEDESGRGLHGALSVFNTRSVRIDGVTASCSGRKRLSGAGIVVNNMKLEPAESGPRSSVQISACELTIGSAQLGILCIDTDVVLIRQNLISCAGKRDESLQRGIVVDGAGTSEVRIEDNIVSDATEGIDVGLPEKESRRGETLHADRVVVVRNSVTLRVGEDKERRRRGIFVGHANSVLVQANRVLSEDRRVSEVEVDAVRLVGEYGRHVVVRDNHFEGQRNGIVFEPGDVKPPEDRETPDRVWLFEFNVAESAKEVLVCDPDLIKQGLVIAQHNIAP